MIAMQQPASHGLNSKAMAWSIGVHLLLLLLFVLFRYTIPTQPEAAPEGGGLEVNLGTSENGSGNDQPMSRKKPSEYQAAVVYKTVATRSSVPDNIVRSTQADAPEVTTPNKKNGKAEANEPGRQRQSPRYVFQGGNGQGGNDADRDAKGRNEGNTNGPGDRGVPGGTPGASNYTGTPGNGTGGIGHTLTGRDISPKEFEAEFSEGGVVVIRVTVDRSGAIVDKRVVSSSSPHLTRLALDKLANARFTRSESTEPQQFGNVTIRFKARQ